VGRHWAIFAPEDPIRGSAEQRRYSAWSGLCLLVLLGLVTADLLLGQDSVAGTLAVPPVMASVLATRRQTAAVGVGALLAAAVLGVWAAGQRTAREQRLAHLTRVAEVAQNAILLPVPSRTGPLALAARYRSASHDASVGGDLLDVVETSTGTFAIVGDVRGKGLAAVRLAASALRATPP
jgi:sigma-B regulation protein RsbU (phosphoserine phosphatase)